VTTIRQVEDDDVDAVLAYIARCVKRSHYAEILTDTSTHDEALMFQALTRGVALAAWKKGTDVVGVIVVPIHAYMGSSIAEEVAWFADDPRDLLRLFALAEREAVQKGANVLKMSAPAGTDLGQFYARHGYRTLETAFVKVVAHGMGERRNRTRRARSSGGFGLRQEEERD
jgi:hypothetical protein